ncbi:MAG: hypothetical protein GY708_24425 [Actinomycetia bacterium]|nr:hypothetical protein [Actinomycetes bacterium]
MVLNLEMLPAGRGDSLLLEYGEGDSPVHRVLIDGGHMHAYQDIRSRLLDIPADAWGRRQFELLVLTHIDTDHIDGVIALLQDPALNCWFNDIWFNGWRHLEPLHEDGPAVADPVTLGPKQGEFLGGLLEVLGLPWNRYFAGGIIHLPDEGPLPKLTITGGLELTLLSPGVQQLTELREEWETVLDGADAQPGLGPQALIEFGSMLTDDSIVTLGDEDRRSTLDNSEANGSSIAFLAEFGDHRLLLPGDAFADVLRRSLDRWRADQPDPSERVALDAFKLPHHGSQRNITPQLMNVISCQNYLISTDGTGRAKHPDVETIVMIRDHHDTASGAAEPTLCFNYRSDQTKGFAGVQGMTALYEQEAALRWPKS